MPFQWLIFKKKNFAEKLKPPLSPYPRPKTFDSSGKMKGMLRFIREVGESLTGELGKKADDDVDFELKVMKNLKTYALDKLGNVGMIK